MAKAKKPKKEKPLKNWLIPKLRKISSHWPERTKALNLAKEWVQVGTFRNGKPMMRVKFRCYICAELFDRENIQVDHVEPVVDIAGFEDWNTYIPALFCKVDNLAPACKECHAKKSAEERTNRASRRKNKKKA